jgi:RNA polymerase sigma-70 factor (ECF subfamily)
MRSSCDSNKGYTEPIDAWARHRGQLYSLCLRWVGGDHHDAEDVVSQVALRAIEERAESDAVISNYPGWLTQLAHNLCVDLHRAKTRRQRRYANLALAEIPATLSVANDPEAEGLRRELMERVLSAIEALPPRLREPCRRRFLDDATYEQIAEDLGLTKETARKRIQQARDILCERLGPYVQDHPRIRSAQRPRPAARRAA